MKRERDKTVFVTIYYSSEYFYSRRLVDSLESGLVKIKRQFAFFFNGHFNRPVIYRTVTRYGG